jgi:hypothetical protein
MCGGGGSSQQQAAPVPTAAFGTPEGAPWSWVTPDTKVAAANAHASTILGQMGRTTLDTTILGQARRAPVNAAPLYSSTTLGGG